MFKYMWEKNRFVMKSAIVLILAVLIMGTLSIVDSVQKYNRAQHTVGIDVTETDGQIKAYNVEGLTDEQISQMLEYERNK